MRRARGERGLEASEQVEERGLLLGVEATEQLDDPGFVGTRHELELALAGVPAGTKTIGFTMHDLDVPGFRHRGSAVAFTGDTVARVSVAFGWKGVFLALAVISTIAAMGAAQLYRIGAKSTAREAGQR